MGAVKQVSVTVLREIIESGYTYTRVACTIGSLTVQLSPQSSRASKARVYAYGHGDPTLPMPPVTARGADPENDKAWDRYNKEEIKLMRALVAEAARTFGIDLGKLTFTRKAGCSCPCSPGFVSTRRGNFQVSITRK